MSDPKTYDEKIRASWIAVSEKNGGQGASPAEVCEEMARRGWLSPLDTVIDIADLMRGLVGRPPT